MASDYLGALRKHGEEIVRLSRPEKISKALSFEYIIITPAVWSASAHAKTRAAAEIAGMRDKDTIRIITEPEAAAVYALHTLPTNSLTIGDVFVVCDAGGGTVDLISYRILAISPILQVEEACVGSGGMCGGTFLNRKFEQFLRQKLENNANWDEDILEEVGYPFQRITPC